MRTTVRILAVVVLACLPVRARVPPPSETPCEVVMSGRTITLKSITVVPVGQEVPETYSSTVKNTPGMSWYVSRHYALKTDHDEATARRYLTYAELAYPFHAWILGRTPPNQDRLRMPFVMGSTLDKTLDAILCDGGWRPDNICGGITYWGMNTAYNWPSGTLQYHQRDLVIHENLHLMMMCCGAGYPPGRLMEGITYTSCNHVFDEGKNQLTLAVFDKPTINMPTTGQLLGIRNNYMTFRDACEQNQHVCLFTAFMWSEPERLMKWRLWRDAMLWEGRAGDDLKVMEEVFGPLDGQIAKDWKTWLDARHATFSYRDWGWEQSGDTLVAYGWPQQGPYSRTDILLPPGVKPEYDPLCMDCPAEPMSTLVGPVLRGVDEPSVGALISFARSPGRGVGGIGLGVQAERPTSELSYMPLLIQGGSALVIRGSDLGLPDETVPFPEDLRNAMTAGGHSIGLTAKIGKDALEVTLRARATDAAAPVEFVKAWPINDGQRQRLLSCPGTLLAKDGYQAITPYFDDARRPEEADLSAPAPGNRWRFPYDQETYRLYRAMRELKEDAPASLRELAGAMTQAMNKDAATRQEATRTYDRQLPVVAKDIRALQSGTADAALAELAGTSMALAFADDATFARPAVAATITGPVAGRIVGDVSLAVAPGDAIKMDCASRPIEAAAGETDRIGWDVRPGLAGPDPFEVAARAVIEWEGVTFTLAKDIGGCPSIPRWLTVGPFDNKGNGAVDTILPPEIESCEPGRKYAGKDGLEIGWEKRERPADMPLSSEYLLDFASLYGGDNVAAYAQTWICSPVETNAVLALGSDDGVIAWLNGDRVHCNMVSRGYASMQDRVPIRLKAGRNKLLVKVAQGGGGWNLSARVMDTNGRPAAGIVYELADAPTREEKTQTAEKEAGAGASGA